MTGLWNAEFWNGLGVVGIVVVVGFLLLLALQRGWIILGLHHREVVAGRDREIAARDKTIAALDSRCDRLGETITIQANTIADKNAVESAVTRILEALRDRKAS